MGGSDDLDDYDAELELRLKREYADVYPLFRFCVVTDEATYLCNELDVDCVPHASYLLFELDMSDVWVWDRNRPTRIIPRAHVYTTGDITVEQLREDADEGDSLADVLPSGVLEQLRSRQRDEDDGDDGSDGGGGDASDDVVDEPGAASSDDDAS